MVVAGTTSPDCPTFLLAAEFTTLYDDVAASVVDRVVTTVLYVLSFAVSTFVWSAVLVREMVQPAKTAVIWSLSVIPLIVEGQAKTHLLAYCGRILQMRIH